MESHWYFHWHSETIPVIFIGIILSLEINSGQYNSVILNSIDFQWNISDLDKIIGIPIENAGIPLFSIGIHHDNHIRTP